MVVPRVNPESTIPSPLPLLCLVVPRVGKSTVQFIENVGLNVSPANQNSAHKVVTGFNLAQACYCLLEFASALGWIHQSVASDAIGLQLDQARLRHRFLGRRPGSIRLLKWEDIDFGQGTIRWRAEADKKRREWSVPIAPALLDELRRAQKQLGAVGDWVFAAEKLPQQAMDRHLLDKWLTVPRDMPGLKSSKAGCGIRIAASERLSESTIRLRMSPPPVAGLTRKPC